MGIAKSIWETECTYGHDKERRVLGILSDLRIRWVVSARLATEYEDHKGIDIVVETLDIGKIFLQIKGSRVGGEKFLSRHGRSTRSICLIVIPHGSPEAVWQSKVFYGLRAERNKILKLREGDGSHFSRLM